MDKALPLQDRLNKDYQIRNCYGCGTDNPKGLRIKTFLEGDEGVSRWRPQEHHCSYPGFLNGGVACTLIDCHSAWTAFAVECREQGKEIEEASDLPTGWTRAMNVEFLKPARLDAEVVLRARVVKKGRTSRTMACSLYSGEEECVRAEVTLVMVGS
jgi:acyl-coenzyme A thioesterase PaaI-like protein